VRPPELNPEIREAALVSWRIRLAWLAGGGGGASELFTEIRLDAGGVATGSAEEA
jgi:predicted Zn-dependent peptidase